MRLTKHIESYNLCISHYRRKNVTCTQYLPRTLTTIEAMVINSNKKSLPKKVRDTSVKNINSDDVLYCMYVCVLYYICQIFPKS